MEEAERKLQEKFTKLKEYLKGLGSVAVAFSGGVDSTFLLKAAHDVLVEHVIAIIARPFSFPKREAKEAEAFCVKEGIRYFFCDFDELQIEGFCENPQNRCYLCKKELFGRLQEMAQEQNIPYLAEGSNMDDNGDYRPGMLAISELGVKSPLREAGLFKTEIRQLAKEYGLAVWEKPSFACLSTRFVYGERITREKLAMVEQAEQFLFERGFRQVRVRVHARMARIEVMPEEFGKLTAKEVREEVVLKFKSYGFTYICMDLGGYRTGSMNETISI